VLCLVVRLVDGLQEHLPQERRVPHNAPVVHCKGEAQEASNDNPAVGLYKPRFRRFWRSEDNTGECNQDLWLEGNLRQQGAKLRSRLLWASDLFFVSHLGGSKKRFSQLPQLMLSARALQGPQGPGPRGFRVSGVSGF
jgi:hypothetical protein